LSLLLYELSLSDIPVSERERLIRSIDDCAWTGFSCNPISRVGQFYLDERDDVSRVNIPEECHLRLVGH
jgi:hypothetical protein